MNLRIKNVLISVSNKNNLSKYSNFLLKQNCNIISTGGTYEYLKYHNNHDNIKDVESITNTPELFNGRVKTLHPAIFAGLLTPTKKHSDLEKLNTLAFDLVNVNLYPFDFYVKKKANKY